MLLPKTPFSKQNHFGVSINDTSVRGVSVDVQGKILNKQEHTFTHPIINGENIATDELHQGLKNIITKGQFQSKYAAVCIPEKYAYTRVHVLPKIPESEISEALNWQIEKIFPFSRHEIYMDWKTIHQNDQQTTILVTVIPKKLLDGLKNTLQSVGIFPISFEPSASALTRLVETEQNSQIILELCTHSTSATLVANNVSSLTTTTTFNQQSAPQMVMQQILTSIQGLLRYMEKNKISTDQTKLVLTGEKASPQLSKILEDTLKVPAKVLTIDSINPSYHLAYVVAHAHILPPSSDQSINLLPTSLQSYYQAQINYTLTKSVVRYILIISIIAIMIGGVMLGSARIVIGKTNRTKENLSTTNIPQQPGAVNIAILNRQANRIIKLFPLKESPEDTLSTISDLIPQSITLTSLQANATNKLFTLTGIAPSRDDLLNLKQAIESTGEFTKINIPLTTLEIQQDINFDISFSLVSKTK